MKKYLLIVVALYSAAVSSQEKPIIYDAALAKALNADDNGMKKYAFCILKTGSNTTATEAEKNSAFEGHMANINRLAKESKLVVAGPFMKNDKNYRGIFIFNVATIDEAQALVETDPAVKSKLLEADLTVWYASAALMETTKIHDKIAKNKF